MAYRTRKRTHEHLQCRKQQKYARERNKGFLMGVIHYVREVNTQEVSLKQQSVNIALEHFSWNTELN